MSKKILGALFVILLTVVGISISTSVININRNSNIKQEETSTQEYQTGVIDMSSEEVVETYGSSYTAQVMVEDSGTWESSTSMKQFGNLNYHAGDGSWIYNDGSSDGFYVPWNYRYDSFVGSYVVLSWELGDGSGDYELNDALVFQHSNGTFIEKVYVSEYYSYDTQVWIGSYGFYLFPDKYWTIYGDKGNFDYGSNNGEGSTNYWFEIFFQSGDGNTETLDWCYFTWTVYPPATATINSVTSIDEDTININFSYTKPVWNGDDVYFYLTINDGNYIRNNEEIIYYDATSGTYNLSFNYSFVHGQTYSLKLYADTYRGSPGEYEWSGAYYLHGSYYSFTYYDVSDSTISNVTSTTNSISFDLEYYSFTNNEYNVYYKENDIAGGTWQDSSENVSSNGTYNISIENLSPTTTYDFEIGIGTNSNSVSTLAFFSATTLDENDSGSVYLSSSNTSSITIGYSFINGTGVYSTTNNLYLDLIADNGNTTTVKIRDNTSTTSGQYTFTNLLPSSEYDIIFYTKDIYNQTLILDSIFNIETKDKKDNGEIYLESKTTSSISFKYEYYNGTGDYSYNDNLYYSLDQGNTLIPIATNVDCTNSCKGQFSIDNLESATNYEVYFYSESIYNNQIILQDTIKVKTNGELDELVIGDINVDSTSATIEYEYTNGSGINSELDSIWYSLDGGLTKTLVTDQPIEGHNEFTISNLNAGTQYNLQIYFSNNENSLMIDSKYFTTLTTSQEYGYILINEFNTNITKTSISIVGNYYSGANKQNWNLYYTINDSEYISTEIYLLNSTEFSFSIDSLTPNTKYELEFYIKDEGNYINIGVYDFSTSNYEVATIDSDSISTTNTSISFSINYYSEENSNFGIYYKDQSGNYIYTGTDVKYSGIYYIEIKNLDPNSDYNFDLYLGPEGQSSYNSEIDFYYLDTLETKTKGITYRITSHIYIIYLILLFCILALIYAIYVLIK